MRNLGKIVTGYLEIAVHWALRILPIDVCSNIGCFLGRWLGPKHYNATQKLYDNIRLLRPDLKTPEQVNAMVKQAWGNYGRVMAEFSVLRRIWASDRTEVDGLEHLIKAKESNRSIIVPFLHLGNWEVLGPKLYGLVNEQPGVQIYQKIDDPYKLRIAENVRRPYADRLITNGPFVGKTLYNKLMDGYNLSLAVDEFVSDELSTPSFGRGLPTTGNLNFVVRLAKLTNSVICPAYITRKQGARFVLHILPPILDDLTHYTRTQLQALMEELDKLIDPIVREHLDQWYYCARLNLSQSN